MKKLLKLTDTQKLQIIKNNDKACRNLLESQRVSKEFFN